MRLEAYVNAIFRANPGTVKELIQMSGEALTIEQVLEEAGWIARWEARGEAKGEARGKEQKKWEIAKNMVTLGLPFETIVSATQLEPEKVKELYQ
jgi:predicted transposase YdaD